MTLALTLVTTLVPSLHRRLRHERLRTVDDRVLKSTLAPRVTSGSIDPVRSGRIKMRTLASNVRRP